ncbi:MAG: SDR family oxidoreductase [Betaproteobacteria bacterium]|nr:SDR family oxidoreductase [Betaproteobacteria bacterium]
MGVRQLFDLTGKVALVTGGSRGLGLQMARALGGMGARVAVSARKADELEHAKTALDAQGIETLTVVNDLAAPGAVAALVDAVVGRFGTIDVLVNNAGTTWGAPAEDYPAEAWRKVMSLNLDALFFLSQRVAKQVMIPKGSGKIVNIASVSGLAGNPPGMATIAYNASKAGVVNLTRALASEWGRHNINVNAICPGFFPSKMSAGLLEKIGTQVIARTPLGRLGGDDDLMGTVVYLSSEASRHVTGQAIAVDGGAIIC